MSSKVIYWGGLAAILGGMLWIALFGLDVLVAVVTGQLWSEANQPLPYRFGGIVWEVALMLVALGLVGLRARLDNRSRRLGMAGSILACVTVAAMVINLPLGTEILGLVGLLGLFGGAILLGVAALRVDVLPRWARVLPLAFGVLGFPLFIAEPILVSLFLPDYAGPELAFVILGGAAVALGYAVRTGRSADALITVGRRVA